MKEKRRTYTVMFVTMTMTMTMAVIRWMTGRIRDGGHDRGRD